MSIFNKETDFYNLINLSPNGLDIADFPTIKRSLENKFKDIYGSDIDISTGTVDGIYIETISILINNILQTFKILYSNLDVNSAYGSYLDTLCALSNIYRKPATKSTCWLTLTLKDSFSVTPDSLSFLDNNSNVWTWENDKFNPITFVSNKSQNIKVTCENYGRINALVGDINTLVGNEYIFEIVQKGNTVVGEAIETDYSLRARRNQTLGNSGVTVLDSLQNHLLSHPDIKDVKIINNNTGEDISTGEGFTSDNTIIKNHNIYIILRKYDESDDSADDEIATIIQNKMTPGIITQLPASNVLGGKIKSKNFNLGTSALKTTISWKESTGVSSDIIITVKPLNYFSTDSLGKIGNKILDYINNLKIGEDLDLYQIRYYATINGVKFRGLPTYDITEVKFKDHPTDQSYKNPLSHFKYNSVEVSSTAPGQSIYTITLTNK